MDIFTVSLFGHREIEDLRRMEYQLEPIVRELMQKKQYVAFLIGRNGEFDEFAASVIKRVQRDRGKENSDITLVLPYPVASMMHYEEYYDGIIIPDAVHGAHPKAAISLKNRWMVEQSDLIVVYAEREGGGAYAAMKYAKGLNKRIINLYEMPYDR